MKTIDPLLQTEIENGTICNCMKITLQDGTVLGYTDHDHYLTVDSVSYTPAPGLQKINYIATASTELSNQEFGSAWVDVPDEDLLAGKFDSAKIEVSWASWKHPSYGRLVVFTGLISELSWSVEGFKADVASFVKNLNINVGSVYTSSCGHALFDGNLPGKIGKCGLDKNSFKTTGSISSIITPQWKFDTGLIASDGYHNNGMIKFTSGLNTGLTFMVKSYASGDVELILPTAYAMTVGDTFEIYAGCDKTLNTCKTKFNNALNFGGYPHIQADVNFR